jgi:hypothetical protein
VRFKNKNMFFYFEINQSSLCNATLALYIVVNSKVEGLAPETKGQLLLTSLTERKEENGADTTK